MKLKNFLISLTVIISSLFITTVKAETAPSSISINGADSYMLHGADYLGNGSTLTFAFKKATNGKLVYCAEIHDDWFYSGTRTFTIGGNMDARIAYVIKNGENITGNKNKDYFITGLAVWYLIAPNDSVFTYFDLDAGTYKGVKSDVVQKIANLVHNSSNYSYTEPTIKVNSNDFVLSSDKKYYVSTLGVNTTGTIGDYTVSLSDAPTGTIVTDTDGNIKNTFAPNARFLVKVPISSIKTLSVSMNVSVSANSSIYKAYMYKPSDNAIQSVIAGYDEVKNVNDNATLKLDIITQIEISKIDATTGKELPGAHLVVKDSNGKVVDEWTSTNEVHAIKNLVPGKYTLSETIAPEGYKLSTETIEFEVFADGTVTKIEMKNYPNKFVYISKQDATTGEELPGATLVLKNEKGKVVETWVSGSTPHKIKNLAPGKYTLTETIAPEGYILSSETVEFTVEKDGTVREPVVMKNYPEEPKTVYISKRDITTGEELPGAYLEIKNERGEVVEAWISSNEPHKVEGLEPGKYTLTETIAPEGYELSKETVEFTVKEDGTVDGMVIMYNKPEEVEVPSTSSFKTITASLIGLIVIGLGSIIIYKNYKKNEEI